jgi:NADP-dependent 3-hydroxy acid dehydrogenase YdfG
MPSQTRELAVITGASSGIGLGGSLQLKSVEVVRQGSHQTGSGLQSEA